MRPEAPTLTADVVARAVIAAARSYGDDPEQALRVTRGRSKRCLHPAVQGLSMASGQPFGKVANLLKVNVSGLAHARAKGDETFTRAAQAAERAARCCAWRPEARASVVSAQESDVVEASPPVEAPAAARPAPKQLAGPISAWMRPTVTPAETTRGLADAERPLRDLVLEALADGPTHTMSLAARLDRKEMAVVTCLDHLQIEGLVTCEPCETGPRRYSWRLASAEAAA